MYSYNKKNPKERAPARCTVKKKETPTDDCTDDSF